METRTGTTQFSARTGPIGHPIGTHRANGIQAASEVSRTTDPTKAKYLIPFGAHKGYGLALMNEIIGAFIGGSLPTLRNRWDKVGDDKGTCAFFFQVWHPDAMNAGAFAKGRDQKANVKAVIDDVLGHGNEKSMLPGQLEASFAKHTANAGGLLFTAAEIAAFNELATEAGQPLWNPASFKTYTV